MRLCSASQGSVQEHIQMGKTTSPNRCHISDTGAITLIHTWLWRFEDTCSLWEFYAIMALWCIARPTLADWLHKWHLGLISPSCTIFSRRFSSLNHQSESNHQPGTPPPNAFTPSRLFFFCLWSILCPFFPPIPAALPPEHHPDALVCDKNSYADSKAALNHILTASWALQSLFPQPPEVGYLQRGDLKDSVLDRIKGCHRKLPNERCWSERELQRDTASDRRVGENQTDFDCSSRLVRLILSEVDFFAYSWGNCRWLPNGRTSLNSFYTENSTLKQKFKKDNYGQLWVSASGLFSRFGWMDWHHLHYGAAPMEAVLVCRGCHHYGRGLVRRPVDVLCISEHRPGAVQDLWLLALAGW